MRAFNALEMQTITALYKEAQGIAANQDPPRPVYSNGVDPFCSASAALSFGPVFRETVDGNADLGLGWSPEGSLNEATLLEFWEGYFGLPEAAGQDTQAERASSLMIRRERGLQIRHTNMEERTGLLVLGTLLSGFLAQDTVHPGNVQFSYERVGVVPAEEDRLRVWTRQGKLNVDLGEPDPAQRFDIEETVKVSVIRSREFQGESTAIQGIKTIMRKLVQVNQWRGDAQG